MSIQSEIVRLQGLRGALRTKLVALGLAQPTATLADCVSAVEGMENRGGVSGTISAAEERCGIPAGYHNGQGTVSIAPVEREKLRPENIKLGVMLLGVAGSYTGEESILQEKTVMPTKSRQLVTADQGYDALSRVTVEAIPSNYADVSGVTARAGEVLANRIFVAADGSETAGAMPNNGAVSASIDGLNTVSYTIPAGYHAGTGKVQLTGDIETALAAI